MKEKDEILHTFRNTTSDQSVCYFDDEAEKKIQEHTNSECVVIGYEKTSQEASE